MRHKAHPVRDHLPCSSLDLLSRATVSLFGGGVETVLRTADVGHGRPREQCLDLGGAALRLRVVGFIELMALLRAEDSEADLETVGGHNVRLRHQPVAEPSHDHGVYVGVVRRDEKLQVGSLPPVGSLQEGVTTED